MSNLESPILPAGRTRSRSSSKTHNDRLISHVSSTRTNDEYSAYYSYDEKIVWTVADQLKLMALHHLQRRILEYHNNIHIKGEEVLGVLTRNTKYSPRYDADNKSDKSDKSDSSFRNSFCHKVMQQNRLKIADYLIKEKENHGTSSKPRGDIEDHKKYEVTANDKFISNLIGASMDENCMNDYGVIAVHFISGTECFPQRLRRDEFEKAIKKFDLRSADVKNDDKVSSDASSSIDSAASISNSCNTKGFVWYHITDISYLSVLSRHYNIHELCLAAFYDYRANSSFISTTSSCVFSFCAFHLNMMDAELNKLIIYCQEGLIVTFESSIMLDLNEMSQSEEEDYQGVNNAFTSKEFRASSPPSNNDLPSDGLVFDRIIEKLHKISGKAQELGTMYIAYQLALECLYIQDTLVEFLSRSLSYVKQEIAINLTYQQKLELLHKMQSILNSSHLLHHNHSKYKKILNILMDATTKNITSGKVSASLNTYLVKDEHFTYIQDLIESFDFSDECVQALVDALQESRIALDAIINLRTSNTSIFLSLVATTFLPLTFFAGVFGMNFSESGDYSITILNSPIGPTVFIAICVGSVVFIIGYFISQGWLELFTPRWISKLFKIQAYTKEDIEREISIKEIEEAKIEETKRIQKSNLLKSLRSKSKSHKDSTVRGKSPLSRVMSVNNI